MTVEARDPCPECGEDTQDGYCDHCACRKAEQDGDRSPVAHRSNHDEDYPSRD